jgi:DNA topoisomerase I
MSKTLVIVESPAKARHIQEYLGNNYVVMASKGHITELAKGGKHGLGVDIDNNFKPHYVLMDDKLDVMDALLAAAKKVDNILVASDPDREGEAIAWHLADRLQDTGKPIKRVVFGEIKKSVVIKAIKSPRDIDLNLFHSQEARRILDRLVGFTASPFLMNYFGNNLSAGRVQSVVTRMIIDREREIENFIPETFWTIQVNLTDGQKPFTTKFIGKLTDEVTAKATKNILNYPTYLISEVLAEEEKKFPQPPMVTSTLQRIMSKQHGFSADRTMKAAQTLYESGYCTYIRTDSVRVGDEALEDVRKWISDQKHELPKKPYLYKNKEAAQDAHECIRPSDINLLPWENFAISDPDEKLVYETIWRSFVASQMMPAVYDTLAVTAHPTNNSATKVKASGKALKIKGYLEILGVSDAGSIDIPNLTIGQTVQLDGGKNPIKMEKKQTQPLPRYSEDKLIKELVNKNIGRPATYAELLSRITLRNYVEKRGQVFHATDLGKTITDELKKYFTFMDYNYTAKMEQQLDEIECGKINHIDMLKKFYPGYKNELNQAYIGHGTDECNLCGSPMVIRKSKTNGSSFLACTAFPKCRNTKPIIKTNAA